VNRWYTITHASLLELCLADSYYKRLFHILVVRDCVLQHEWNAEPPDRGDDHIMGSMGS